MNGKSAPEGAPGSNGEKLKSTLTLVHSTAHMSEYEYLRWCMAWKPVPRGVNGRAWTRGHP